MKFIWIWTISFSWPWGFTIFFILTRYLLNKYFYNIYVELWVLLFALSFLWLSSDDFLELNLKLVACTTQLLIYTIELWKNQMMLVALMITTFFILIIPSSVMLPICLQTAIFCFLSQFIASLLHFRLYGTRVFKKNEGKFIPFVVGNYN